MLIGICFWHSKNLIYLWGKRLQSEIGYFNDTLSLIVQFILMEVLLMNDIHLLSAEA